VRIRALAPLVAATMLVVPAAANAAVRCVGTTGSDCTTTHATTDDALTFAVTGEDTIRFGPGTFGPVDTPKVLTWVGAGAGTPDSAAGATLIQQTTAAFPGMNLQRGGTVRALRAEGGPDPGGMGSAGTGIRFAPTTDGDMSLTLVDVIATGGPSSRAFGGGTGVELGETLTTGSKVANITGGAFLGSATPTAGGTGVSTRHMQSTITGALIRTPAGGGVDADVDSTLTLNATTVEGVSGIRTQGADAVTVNRSRINAAGGIGLFLRSATDGPINVSLRDSIVFAGSAEGETAAAVTIEGATGDPVAFEAVGSTLVARGTSHGVDASRAADASAGITATLRNSIVRAEGTGVDLLADRATIGAEFSSFNTRQLENGGTAPEPGSLGNVAGDPLLAADYTLLPGSPLIDRGDPSAVLAGELDLAGAARSLDGTGDCVAAPDIGAFERPDACPPPVANLAPELANVGVTNKVFAPRGARATATARRRVKRGTRFRYTLSEAARVAITIERVLPGRVRGRGARRRCVKPTRRNRGARRCKRYRRVTTLVADEQVGRQSTPFSGRVRRRPLRPGVYRARLVATDALGARSQERRLRLRIVRP
jgi:hypothetical protein